MKLLLLALLTMSSFANAFELMKCTSQKNGTMFASFGHLMRSGSDAITTFPTEIVVLKGDQTTRLLYPTVEQALQVNVITRPRSIHIDFSAGTTKHLLQLLMYDPRLTNSFLGNWTVSTPGQPDSSDLLACTAD